MTRLHYAVRRRRFGQIPRSGQGAPEADFTCADPPFRGVFELRLGRTRFRMHPLVPLSLCAMRALGLPGEPAALLAALSIHEAGHLAAARLLGIRVNALRMMPFGGAMDLGNPYALSPGQLLAVSAAGPLGNVLGILLASALAQLGWLAPAGFLSFLRISLTLMLFNLLPALPLDGGRMLFAMASPRLGRDCAVRIGILSGRVLAVVLAALAVAGWWQAGRLNLSPLLAAVFLAAAGPGERRALSDTRAQSLLSALRPVSRPMPAKVFAVAAGCPARVAIRAASPDAVSLYAVYDGSRLAGFTDERALLERLAAGGAPTAGAALEGGARLTR